MKAIRDLEATTESRLDALVQIFESRLETMEQNLESRLDALVQIVESRLETMEQNLESRLDALVQMVESRLDDIEEIYVAAWERRRSLTPTDSEAIRSQIEITGGTLEDWSSNGESDGGGNEECDDLGGFVVPHDIDKRAPPKGERHPK